MTGRLCGGGAGGAPGREPGPDGIGDCKVDCADAGTPGNVGPPLAGGASVSFGPEPFGIPPLGIPPFGIPLLGPVPFSACRPFGGPSAACRTAAIVLGGGGAGGLAGIGPGGGAGGITRGPGDAAAARPGGGILGGGALRWPGPGMGGGGMACEGIVDGPAPFVAKAGLAGRGVLTGSGGGPAPLVRAAIAGWVTGAGASFSLPAAPFVPRCAPIFIARRPIFFSDLATRRMSCCASRSDIGCP